MTQAFLVYNFLLLFLCMTWYPLSSVLPQRPQVPSERYLLAALFTIVIYSLTLGLRYNVGGDYDGYVKYYVETTGRVLPAEVPFEIGFYWLIRTLKYVEAPTASLFVATCAIQIIFMVIWLRRYLFLSPWFFYFYFTTLLAFESLNTVRQAMAFMVLLCAIPHLIARNIIPYVVLVTMACTLHASAVIFLPLYFLLAKEIPFGRFWQICVLVLVYIVADFLNTIIFNVLPMLSMFIGYDAYGNIQKDLFFKNIPSYLKLGVLFSFLTDAIIIFLAPWLERLFASHGFRVYYNAFYIGALIRPLSYFSGYVVFARLGFYFLSFKFIVLSFLLVGLFSTSTSDLRSKLLGGGLVAAYFVWFSWAIANGAASCAPFQFVFE